MGRGGTVCAHVQPKDVGREGLRRCPRTLPRRLPRFRCGGGREKHVLFAGDDKAMGFSIISQDFESAQIREPFSVCMTVKHAGHSIGAFLESLMAQTAAADEIMIVDGGS